MKSAYRLDELAEMGPFGRTKLFAFAKERSLPAQRRAGTTYVTAENWARFLADAPLATDARRNSNATETRP